MTDLFSPFTLGRLTLPNRIVMAPMTRNRAAEGDVPSDLAITYYAQRASAGLIITEASQVSAQGKGYPGTPGIFTEAQVAGWRKITEAVHERGGHIFLQLWHVGRISHPSIQQDGALPVAPTALAPKGETMTFTGMQPFVTPRALETSEIPGIVKQFADGAHHAKAAGFDGVEVHGANGYLLDQFLRDGTNQRTDEYGGSVHNRARLLLEVTEAAADVWGRDRVGVRLSPQNPFNDIHDSDEIGTFAHAVQHLNRFGLAYLHVIDPVSKDNGLGLPATEPVTPLLRELFSGPLMVNGGYTKETGQSALQSGSADLIAYGVPFIANPDLVARFAKDAPLAEGDQTTFYGGDAHGYTDYPALDQEQPK